MFFPQLEGSLTFSPHPPQQPLAWMPASIHFPAHTQLRSVPQPFLKPTINPKPAFTSPPHPHHRLPSLPDLTPPPDTARAPHYGLPRPPETPERCQQELLRKSEVTQLCPTFCDPMNCSPPGSSVHGILQARILGWVAPPFSKGSSQPKDQTGVSCIIDRCFTV